MRLTLSMCVRQTCYARTYLLTYVFICTIIGCDFSPQTQLLTKTILGLANITVACDFVLDSFGPA